MKYLPLVLCLLLAACGEDPPANGNERFVTQDRLHSPWVDTESVDKAVHTEAMMHMSRIHQSVKLAIAKGADKAALYRGITGQVSGAKLAKIGLSEADLKGTYYIASDYSISFSGNKMTIEAAQKGTRGRVEPQSFTVP